MFRPALPLLLLSLGVPSFAAATPSESYVVQSQQPAFQSNRIGVEVRGSGPDVILIPGLSSGPEIWDSTVAAVPGFRYHLIHVDGFAGRPSGANADGAILAPVAEEIARYIRETGLEKSAIVGHSLGGTWAMMVASRYPDLVSRIMVVDMMPFMGAMFMPNATPEQVRPIAEQIRQGIANAPMEQAQASSDAMIATMVRTESLRPIAVRHSMASDPVVSGQLMFELVTTDLRPDLRKIEAPMAVLWVQPPGSPLSETQMAEFYRLSYENAPQAVVTRVPESYHFIMWDSPDRFRDELRTFLRP